MEKPSEESNDELSEEGEPLNTEDDDQSAECLVIRDEQVPTEVKTDDQKDPEIIFSVKFVELPVIQGSDKHERFLLRTNEKAYKSSCGKVFRMHAFPIANSKLKKGFNYRDEFVQISQISLAVRVRRLLLFDELEKLRVHVDGLEKLINVCNLSIRLHTERLNGLEEELKYLQKTCSSDAVTSPFCAMLMHTLGFNTVMKIIAQNIVDVKAKSKTNSIPITLKMLRSSFLAWDLLQYWQLIYAVKVRCELGERKYPIKMNQANKKIAAKTKIYRESWKPIREEINSLRPYKGFDENNLNDMTEFISGKKIKYAVQVASSNSILCDWSSICRALGTDDRSLYGAISSIISIVTSPTLIEFIHQDTIRSLRSLIASFEDDSISIENKNMMIHLLTILLDDIADELELILKEDILHESPLWDDALGTLRRERILQTGGQLVIRNNIELELDRYGEIKSSIPIADGFVDTAIFHNSLQRIRANIAIKKAETELTVRKSDLFRFEGELACVVQFGFESSVTYLQRFFRMVLARKFPPMLLNELTYKTMSACACMIQSWYRCRVQKKLYQIWKQPDYEYYAIRIQTNVRGYLQRLRYQKMYEEWLAATRHAAAIKIQALVRGYLIRCKIDLKKILGDIEAQKRATTITWAAVIIQKRIRGYLVRTSIIRSLKIRKHLSKDILKLTEKYLDSGDLWGFLKEIDREFQRLSVQADIIQQREDEYATTFVEKVLVKRRAEYDQAWSTFSRVMTAEESTRNRVDDSEPRKNEDSQHHQDEVNKKEFEKDNYLSSISRVKRGGNNDHKKGRKLKQVLGKSSKNKMKKLRSVYTTTQASKTGVGMDGGSEIHHNSIKEPTASMDRVYDDRNDGSLVSAASLSYGHSSMRFSQNGNSGALLSPIPGTRLRKAISATVNDRVTSILEQAQDDYEKDGELGRTYLGHKQDNRKINSSISHSGGDALDSSHSKKSSMKRPLPVNSLSESSPSPFSVSHSSRLPPLDSERSIESSRSLMSLGSQSSSKSRTRHGEVGGKDVDELSTSSSRSSPFVYKDTRHPVLWTEGINGPDLSSHQNNTNNLNLAHDEEFNAILNQKTMYKSPEDLAVPSPIAFGGPLPFHGDSLLTDIPLGQDDTLEKLIRAASVRCYVPEFLPNVSPEDAFKIYQNMPPGLARVRYQESCWKWSLPIIVKLRGKGVKLIKDFLPISKLTMYMRAVEAPKELKEACAKICLELKRMDTMPKGFKHNPTIRKSKKIIENNGEYLDKGPKPPTPDPPPPPPPPPEDPFSEDTEATLSKEEEESLAALLTSENSWMSLKADLEELLQHAGYFVCRHVPLRIAKSTDYVDATMGDIGPNAFRGHLLEFHRLKREEHKKECVRVRVRHATELIEPYLLCLKAAGIETVMDLILTDLTPFGFPDVLREQVEKLLNIAVGEAIRNKIEINSRKFPKKVVKSSVKAPLTYDPRFQRSPFDPFGVAPRVSTLNNLVKEKRKLKLKKERKVEDDRRAAPVNKYEEESTSLLPGGLWDDNDKYHHHYSKGNSDDEDSETGSKITGTENEDEEVPGVDILWRFQSEDDSGSGDKHAKVHFSVDSPQHQEKALDGDLEAVMESPFRLADSRNSTRTATRNSSKTRTKTPEKGLDSSNLLQEKSKDLTIKEEILRWRQSLRGPIHTESTTNRATSPSKKFKDRKDEFIVNVTPIGNEYICRHIGCGKAFSRQYTLKIHEKSHTLFASYSNYTDGPKVFFDPGVAATIAEYSERVQARATLPPIIQKEIDSIVNASKNG